MDKIIKKYWFTVQLKPNSYLIAQKNLHRQNFQTFVPLEDVTIRSANRFTTKTKLFFPGYMFVRTILSSRLITSINSTIGVNKILSFSKFPKPIPDSIINRLKDQCDQNGKIMFEKKIEVGDSYQILNGPFANFMGKIEKIESDKRIWLLLDTINKKTIIKIKKVPKYKENRS